LLVVAIALVVTGALMLATGGTISRQHSPIAYFALRMALILVIVGFFCFFWTRRGQTLGMAAWRLRLERDDGRKLTWADALKRLAAACLSWLPVGLGFLWLLVDPKQLAWHDRLTRTRVIVDPKQP
jgi:uncharacterized RDD family membrane protein YckC